MEWLTQSLPDVRRDSEKARMGSNDLAPCSALLCSTLTTTASRDLFIFSLQPHMYVYMCTFPEVRRPRKMKIKNARSTSLSLGWIISLLQMSSNFATSERKIGARSLARNRMRRTSVSLSLVIICAEFCLSRCSRAEMLRADAQAISQEFCLLLWIICEPASTPGLIPTERELKLASQAQSLDFNAQIAWKALREWV